MRRLLGARKSARLAWLTVVVFALLSGAATVPVGAEGYVEERFEHSGKWSRVGVAAGPAGSFALSLWYLGNSTELGAVYVYSPDGAGGFAETKLTASDGTRGHAFGNSLAIGPDGTVVIGAPGGNDGDKMSTGVVYVYRPDGAGGYNELKIAASDAEHSYEGDRFGQTVAIGPDGTILVSAPRDDDRGKNAGAAYVFAPDGEGYAETKLLPSLGEQMHTGVAFTYDGSAIMAVGPYMDYDSPVRLEMYSRDGSGTYAAEGEVTSDVPVPNDGAMAVSPAGAVATISREAAYLFTPDGGGGYSSDRFEVESPRSLAFGPDGTLVVGSGEAAIVFSPDGDGGYSRFALYRPDRLQFAWSVAVLDDGTVAVGGGVDSVVPLYLYSRVASTSPRVTIQRPEQGEQVELGRTFFASYFCADTDLVSCTGSIPHQTRVHGDQRGDFELTVTGVDAAGDETIVTHQYSVVDSRRPSVYLWAPGQYRTNRYYVGDVVDVEYGCYDLELVSCIGSVRRNGKIDTSTPGEYEFEVVSTDESGNTTIVTSSYVVLSRTGPPVSISSPEEMAVYERGEVIRADYSCDSDARSCTGSVPVGQPIDTSEVGAFDFTVDALGATNNRWTMAHQPYFVVAPGTEPPKPALYLSAKKGGRLDGLMYRDEDVLHFDLETESWSMAFDGSDVGLERADVDAIHIEATEPELHMQLSFAWPVEVPGVGLVDDSDVVIFRGTGGTDTRGEFELLLDGSEDLQLKTGGEDIDALAVIGDATLLSTTSRFHTFVSNANPGTEGNDEDLLEVQGPAVLGALQNALALDGSTLGLGGADISGVSRPTLARVYLTTSSNATTRDLSVDREDVVLMTGRWDAPETITVSRVFDGGKHGLGGRVIDALHVVGFPEGDS